MLRFGVAPTQWGDLFPRCLEETVLAERKGFTSVWMLEHHGTEEGYFPSPLAALEALATSTKTMRLGTCILILPIRHPLHVAEEAALLDVVSGGRLVLGVGLGYRREEFEAFGVPLGERGSRLEEGVELIKRLWTESSVTFKGKHFTLDNVSLSPKPLQRPRPPIWIGGWSRAQLRRAASLGDSWLPGPVPPFQKVKECLAIYGESLRRLGKDMEDVELPLMRNVHVAEDGETAWSQAEKPLLSMYRSQYLEWGHYLVKPGEEAEKLIGERCIIGSPDECIQQIERHRRELGVTQLLCRVSYPGLSAEAVKKSITLLGEKVIPYFAEPG